MNNLILDTSTLILLAKIDLLEPLTGLMSVMIPAAVKDEATHKKDLLDAKTISRLIEEQKIKVIKNKDFRQVRKLAEDFRLGEGESQAIFLAKQESSLLGIDDGPGIKACKVLGVRFTTALAFVERFYQKSVIGSAQAIAKLERLGEYGWYHEALIEKALDKIRRGEER